MALRPRGGTARHQLGTRGRLGVGRVGTGFGLEVLISVPLGVAMGTSAVALALLEPTAGLLRYMSAAAFIPLLII
ncbi:hypothetical protein GCM10018952_62000 [Streptosporangium vulgare]